MNQVVFVVAGKASMRFDSATHAAFDLKQRDGIELGRLLGLQHELGILSHSTFGNVLESDWELKLPEQAEPIRVHAFMRMRVWQISA